MVVTGTGELQPELHPHLQNRTQYCLSTPLHDAVLTARRERRWQSVWVWYFRSAMYVYDVVLLTDARYVDPPHPGEYERNILTEDGLLTAALEKEGLRVYRTNWDNPAFEWSHTRSVLFRTTWDYFDRYAEFLDWLYRIQNKTRLINSLPQIVWNMDKHYLGELQDKGLAIPPTLFVERGERRSLSELVAGTGWSEIILKPAVGGAARHTYRIESIAIAEFETTFIRHIREEAFLIQQFQSSVLEKGEVALMVIGGVFTHAVLKRAKQGDFRVQDDFGGSVHFYTPTPGEIAFAEEVVRAAPGAPVYARVDIIYNHDNAPCVSELEIVEPELWFRHHPPAASALAGQIARLLA